MVLKESVPWKCPVCCPERGTPSSLLKAQPAGLPLQVPLRWAWASLRLGWGWPSTRPKAGLLSGTQGSPRVSGTAVCVRSATNPREGAEGPGETLAGCGRAVQALPAAPPEH